MAGPLLSVILPTYNESGNLPTLVERLETALAGIDHEIIVVDDNSPDRTWELAERLADATPGLRVIRRLHERGLSSAVVAGMSAAAGEYFAVMDADLQHDEGILPAMLKALHEDGFDLCIGSRATDGGSYGDWTWTRRLISAVAALLAKLALPVQVRDPMSGFFVVRRQVFHDSAERINPVGFKILLEFIGRNRNLKIKEIGYRFRNRIHGETKLSGSVIKNYLVALYDLRFGRYISATFILYSLVGASGVLVNFGGFAAGEALALPVYYFNFLGKQVSLHMSAALGIELSILSNYVLNNWITFSDQRHRGAEALRGLAVFQLISMVGLMVQLSVFEFLYTGAPLPESVGPTFGKYFYYGVAILVAMITNYSLNLNFTWRKKA